MSTGKVAIQANQAASSAPLSQAIAIDGIVFTSGQVGVNPADGTLGGPDATAQTRQCLDNLKALVEAAGFSMSDVLKTTVFLTDIADFEAMNAVYREFFSAPFPARSTVAIAALARPDLVVEIEAVAGRGGAVTRT